MPTEITPPRVPDRAADLGQRQEGIQGCLRFRDRLVDEREDEGVDDLVADRLAGLQRPAQVGAGLLDGGPTGPVTAAGELNGGRGEPLRCGVPGPSHQTGVHLAQSERGMAEQDQRDRCGCGSGRPQDAGDLAEGEFAFEDAGIEALLSSESHGRAFRECSLTALPDDLSPDHDPRGEHPCRNVHGYHLLGLSHGLQKLAAAAVIRHPAALTSRRRAPWRGGHRRIFGISRAGNDRSYPRNATTRVGRHYFGTRSMTARTVAKSTGKETCSWLISHPLPDRPQQLVTRATIRPDRRLSAFRLLG
ncbi:hypothetical protein [Micromonospora sp. CPCC 206061]|uniref:hypothetical protein n=1 Tax=Micromonospora sp. CPCC 206061 TaxID=3122410 RepID=UPI002FF18CBD